MPKNKNQVQSTQKSSTNLNDNFSYKCKLDDLPKEEYIGGYLKLGHKKAFPALQNMAAFSLTLEKGGLRIPHWHPNCAELDYCVEGKARMTIISPKNQKETIIVEAGDIVFVPRGSFHYIENIGEETLRFFVTFDNDMPSHISVTEAIAGIPGDVLSATFKVPETTFDDFEKSDDLLTSKKVKTAKKK